MTDASRGNDSQYAVIAPISLSSDISPSRQTRESSNVFLQEHTVLSELKNRERSRGHVKYVDLELSNVDHESREEEEPVFKKETTHNPNKEDWTFPRPKARKTPPPIVKPKPISKAKSTAQIPLSEDLTSSDQGPVKQRTASESDTVVPPNSVKRPSRKAPPPPRQLQQVQCDKNIAEVPSSQPQPSSNGTKELVQIPPPSLRSQSSERELEQITSPSPPLASKELVDGVPQSPKQPRASPPQDGKVYRPVRKAPPPPNKSTEYINVVKNGGKNDNDVMFSTFFVSHKKSQSLGYVNVFPAKDRSPSLPRSRVSASPQRLDEYENVTKKKTTHKSDEGIAHNNNQEYENVVVQPTESNPNNPSSESKPNVVDNGGGGGICPNQGTTSKSKENTNQRQATKRKSIKKKKVISPPHSPPPPPPPGANRKLMPSMEIETDNKVVGSLSPPPPGRTKRPMGPAPPPPSAARRPNAPPPPPPDMTQAASLQVVLPPPPPPPVETATTRSSESDVPHVTKVQVSIVHNSVSEPEQNDTTAVVTPVDAKTIQVSTIASNSKFINNKLSPEFSKSNLAKRPPTSPPSMPPPPPPTFPSAFPSTPPGHGGHIAFITSSDVESGEDSNVASASASETSMQQLQQEGASKDTEVAGELVEGANSDGGTYFLRQSSRELEPITEYADTESSGSVYITRTVSSEALSWTSDDQLLSTENSPHVIKRLDAGGDSSSSEDSRPRNNVESSLVSRREMDKVVPQKVNSETDNNDIVANEETHLQEEHISDNPVLREKDATSTANPFWYRESMVMAVSGDNVVNHVSTRKPPVPPPRSTTLGPPPVIQDLLASPARFRRVEPKTDEATRDEEQGDIEISLVYTEDSLTSNTSSSSNSGGPIPPPRFKPHNYTAEELKPPPPVAPPRDRSSMTASSRTVRQPTRVRAASFLTVSAGKELNTVSVTYMGSKQVDHYVGQINDIARELQEKQSSSIILYIATEKIRLAAPNSTVLLASFAVENILATTLCAINKRIVGILVWKSRSLPSWHLIRCPDNLVAVGVLEAVQMACETVKSDEIMEVRPLSQITVLSNGSTEEEQPKTSELFRKFPVISIGVVKVSSEATTVSEMIDGALQTLVPSTSVEAQLWLSIYQVRLVNVTSGLMFAQYDTSNVKLFGTLARDKRYLGIVIADTESSKPSTLCVIIRCKTLAHVVTILSYLREACQVSFLETVDNTNNTMSSSSTIDRESSIKLDDEDDSDNDEQFAMEILKSFSGTNKAKTLPSPVPNKKTIKARLKSIKGTLTGSIDRTPTSTPLSIPIESSFRSHIQGDHSPDPVKSPLGKQMSFSKLSNPEEYAKFTMTYIGSTTLEGVVTGSTVFDALQAIEEGGVAAGAALVTKNQITFVAAANGVTLVDPSEKMFFTRHYPKNQIEAFLRGPDRSNIMGFVTKMTGFGDKIKCHILAESVEPLSQIFSAVEYWLQLDNETLV